ncbi:single-stranded DNA-binding protein [Brevibacterium antiquum]|uniref:Single-strand binding protein family protein n=1 Tax=Brevibacterium antiquum TaxID=234835 RepID=A0A2H1IMX3_9MICO|nr:single-stranded DNA-binding protein [Brevibacterium antiquum]SMX76514.1 Single-strand binding protein family protein [Brevibacterium antiquum]
MSDARTTIDGVIASDPRFNTTPNGAKVANIRVLAGRSKPDGNGGWEQLSTTAYDVAFWKEHADLASALNPERGSKVTVTGTITGVEKYDGQNGESLSIKVNGEGLRVFPKRDQQQGGGNFGGQQSQQNTQQGNFQQGRQQQAQQSSGWGQNPGGNDESPF